MTQTIVCGVDQSPGARAAAEFAATLAQQLGSRLVLVHAVQPPVPHRDIGMPDAWDEFSLLEQLRDAGAELVEKLEQELAPKCEVTTVVRVGGGASEVISTVAAEEAAEFVVVGARGLGSLGKFLLGSVSLRLATDAPCPSVLVPESGGTLGGGPIMCAVDESEHSRRAVATAAMLAERLDTKLLLVHAAQEDASSSRGEELLARLVVESGLGTSVERIVLRGDPAEAIVKAADAHGAAMIVIGSRGRGALASAVLGSVSSAVATQSTCPVTVVGDRSTPAAAEHSAD
jgi:nucleotide-binding universal stress UspA family protein